jgi:alpha-beta hydrolase superfamily lysophospholipase
MLKPQQRESNLAVGENIRLSARIESPPQPRGCIVISHGFGEHSGRYDKLVQTFIAIGLTTIRYDLRGHGQSGGKRGHVSSYDVYLDDLGRVIELARDVEPTLPIFIFGHSMGGGLVLNYALRRGGKLAGVIASGPWLRLAFQPPAWKVLLARLIAGVLPTMSMPTNLDITKLSHDPEVAKSIEHDSLTNPVISAAAFLALVQAGKYALSHAAELRLPLLLMHGGDDAVTDIRASETFFAAAGVDDKTFKRWEGMYHETLNEIGSEPVFQAIVDWLKPRLTPSKAND